jgi:hypothetical protein
MLTDICGEDILTDRMMRSRQSKTGGVNLQAVSFLDLDAGSAHGTPGGAPAGLHDTQSSDSDHTESSKDKESR